MFEDFGIGYIGPVDGHNLEQLIKTLENVKKYRNYKPVLIHTITKKGHGYKPAEDDTYKLHGVDNSKPSGLTFTDIFSKKILELGKTNEKIVCITAAMGHSCGLTEFAKTFPERFFDVGIAEEHAVTFAAGLAKEGFCPFVCIYSSFLQRAFDQIYHDVILSNLPVRFIIDKAGFPGKDGKTHSGVYDIAMLSMFKNIQIFVPICKDDFINTLDLAGKSKINGPLAIRFPKGEPNIVDTSDITVKMGKNEILVFQIGSLELPIADNVDIIYACKIQPFDYEEFLRKANQYKKIFVVEEGIYGGFSSLILNYCVDNQYFEFLKKVKFVNIPKEPVIHDTVEKQKLQVLRNLKVNN